MSMDPNIWVGTLPKTKKVLKQESYNLNANRWISSIPKEKENVNFSKIKYSLTIILFVVSLIGVSLIKNETRNLQKKINNLQASINDLKLDWHQETLDHEVITSPENISKLAHEYLEFDLTFYSKSQIKKFNQKKSVSSLTEDLSNKKNLLNKTYEVTDQIKNQMVKKVEKKKENLKRMQQLYSEPKKLPKEIKSQVAKKVKKTKSSLKKFYNDPMGSVDKQKLQKWAAIQVVKVFFGIPVIPGR